MSSIFLIHGAYGNPEGNWFPWIKTELEKIGHSVYVPKFPTPENQTLESWRKVFQPYEDFITEDSIFVGHSLGVPFILSLLENLDSSIQTAYLVSGFVTLLGNPEFDDINRTFVEKDFDWKKIKQHCQHFIVIHSDNDPYVPMSEAVNLAQKLSVEPIIFKNAGHFNQAVGYTEFSWLLERMIDLPGF